MSEKIKYSPFQIISHAEEYVSDNRKYLTVKQNNGYYYAERKGIDSVAFVLFGIDALDEKRIGLINEFKPPIEHSLISAFNASIDDEKYHEDLRILVKEEAMEEAGFDVKVDDIDFYGKYYVSTQQNQFCYLFGITVDKTKQKLRTTTNIRELDSSIVWVSLSEIPQLEDWKAMIICTKRLVAHQSVINIRKAQKSSILDT